MKVFYRGGLTAVLMAGVMFAGGVAEAASPSAQKVCVNRATGVMRYLRKTGKQTCEKSEVKLIWNKSGVAGATGASGSGAITQQSICGAGGTSLCKIGVQGPGGGLIFFVDYNDQYSGFNYLEAAPLSCEGTSKAWSSDTTHSLLAVNGWAARAVGSGQANTTAMMANGSTSYVADTSGAAFFADSSTCCTKTDWFLGSLGEMMLMYTNLRQAGVGGFSTGAYWSSSEGGAISAWLLDFAFGDQANPYTKPTTLYVRPVRAF
mgnify:CR=1 FL=1